MSNTSNIGVKSGMMGDLRTHRRADIWYDQRYKDDKLVKSQIFQFDVIPAKAGHEVKLQRYPVNSRSSGRRIKSGMTADGLFSGLSKIIAGGLLWNVAGSQVIPVGRK